MFLCTESARCFSEHSAPHFTLYGNSGCLQASYSCWDMRGFINCAVVSHGRCQIPCYAVPQKGPWISVHGRTDRLARTGPDVRRSGNWAACVSSGTRARYFPLEVIKQCGQLGFPRRDFPGGTGRRGLSATSSTRSSSKSWRVSIPSVGLIVAAHNSLCTNHIFTAGNRRAEAELHSEARDGRMDRLLVAD